MDGVVEWLADLSDAEVAFLNYACAYEEDVIRERPGYYFRPLRDAGQKFRLALNKEYRKRKLHYSMFMDEE